MQFLRCRWISRYAQRGTICRSTSLFTYTKAHSLLLAGTPRRIVFTDWWSDFSTPLEVLLHALLVILCKIATPVLESSKSAFAQIITLLLHCVVLCWLGKHMLSQASSPSEPLFLTHASHILLDMLMEKMGHCVWRKLHTLSNLYKHRY